VSDSTLHRLFFAGGGSIVRNILILVMAMGCTPKELPNGVVDANPDGNPPSDVDADTDSDADSDADSDTDTDTDADSDTDTGPDADADDGGVSFPCDADVNPPTVDSCVAHQLRCDQDPVLWSTRGGPSMYDAEHYVDWMCFPFGDGPYEGPDRVFAFTHPGGGNVVIDLHTPCGELDLFALQWTGWADSDECPTAADERLRCEDDTDDGDGSLTLYEDSQIDYLIVVDGPDSERENFTIAATCP
jgi:hypothetical protein